MKIKRSATQLFIACQLIAACGSDASDSSKDEGSASEQADASTADASKPAAKATSKASSTKDAGDTDAAKPAPNDKESTDSKSDSADSKGDAADGDIIHWTTDEFKLAVGDERYLCFAKTMDEDVVINGYSSMPESYVHHLVFARTRAPEPEGFSECDVAFRNTWDMIYASGAGANKLDFPADAGHKIAKGTQLLAQLHLLNTGTSEVNGKVTVNMRRSTVENPRPVNPYIFGSADVKLPANHMTDVVGDCAMRDSVQLIGGLPHMHQLGYRMLFEAQDADGNMREVFKRDPFSFDDQHVDMLDVKLAMGAQTRVTCTFNNTLSNEVSYGESTKEEMCYFVGFAIDRPMGGSCIAKPPAMQGM